jgi:phosphoribosyl-ATP pyrophosphohydrolase/phosphoribosyl-AMP cyclohydrolase
MFDALFSIIEARKRDKPKGSYTCHLLDGGEDLILRKIGEETIEVLLASKSEGEQRLVEETADLIYHVFVLMSHKGISLDQVKAELKKRHQRQQ